MVVDNSSPVNVWKFTDFTFHHLSLQNIFTFVSDWAKDRFDKTVVLAVAVNFSSLSVDRIFRFDFFFFFLQRNSLANRIERRIYLGTKHHRRKGGQRSRVELMREESRSRLLLRRVKMPGMLNESFKKDGSMYAE